VYRKAGDFDHQFRAAVTRIIALRRGLPG